MCLFQFWFPWCVGPAVGLLGCVAGLFPVFYGISILFSIAAVPVCIPTNSVRGSLFSTPSSVFIVCRLLVCSPCSNRRVVFLKHKCEDMTPLGQFLIAVHLTKDKIHALYYGLCGPHHSVPASLTVLQSFRRLSTVTFFLPQDICTYDSLSVMFSLAFSP